MKEFLTNYSDIPTAAIKDMMRCLPDLEKMLCSAFHRKVMCLLVCTAVHNPMDHPDLPLGVLLSGQVTVSCVQCPVSLC